MQGGYIYVKNKTLTNGNTYWECTQKHLKLLKRNKTKNVNYWELSTQVFFLEKCKVGEVQSGMCPVGDVSRRGCVRPGKCPVGDVSGRGSVRSEKCPVGEVSGRGSVQSGKCPVGEVSGRGSVLSGKCPVGEVSGRGSVQSGKCPVGEVSRRGSVRSGNRMVKELVILHSYLESFVFKLYTEIHLILVKRDRVIIKYRSGIKNFISFSKVKGLIISAYLLNNRKKYENKLVIYLVKERIIKLIS